MSAIVRFDRQGWAELTDSDGDPSRVLYFTPREWEEFIGLVKGGAYDDGQRRATMIRIAELEQELADLKNTLNE